MIEKMLFDMLGISKETAQQYAHNAISSFERFEKAITSIAIDVAAIKKHLGIDEVPSEILLENKPVEKEQENAA